MSRWPMSRWPMSIAVLLCCAAVGVAETAAAQQPGPLPVPMVECPTNDQPGRSGPRAGVSMPAPVDGRMAEQIVGHVLPSELIHAGSLDAFRRKAA